MVMVGILALMGCGSRPKNVALTDSFWETPKQKIMIAAYKAPEPEIHTVGEQGLLDMAITSVATREINAAVKRTELTWYHHLPTTFAQRLKGQHMEATLYDDPIENGKKGFEHALAQAQDNKLLTLKLRAIGARREYYGFLPTSAPEGYCSLVGELIDPTDKKVLWRHEVEIKQPVQGSWDQPPNFPNFSHALEEAVASAKDELLDSFFSGR